MGFVVGTETEKIQEKEIKGQRQKVAVGCWYTSNGRSIPQMIKFETEEGVLQEIKQIQVLDTEKKYYAGILLQRFNCKGVAADRVYDFTLLYHPDNGIWDLVFAKQNG